MAFWTDINTKEPLRQNRWYIRFATGLSSFRFALKEIKKPEYEIGVTEHRLLTHVLRYPTLLKWKPVDIKMVSAINESQTLDNALETLKNNFGYSVPNTAHQQIAKNKNSVGTFIELIQVDANGNTVETWTLNNPFISSVSYGTLTYENDGFVDISMTIQYDWAEQVDGDFGTLDESKSVSPGFPNS